jgi:hypothetical protein
MPYKKPSEFTERDKQIVKCLNQVKWSSTCDTLETFLDTYGLDLKDIEFKVTSDNESQVELHFTWFKHYTICLSRSVNSLGFLYGILHLLCYQRLSATLGLALLKF